MLEEMMAIAIILIVVITWEVGWIRDKKEDYKIFDKKYPVGCFYWSSSKKKKFLFGKWEYLGKNVDGSHIFERVK